MILLEIEKQISELKNMSFPTTPLFLKTIKWQSITIETKLISQSSKYTTPNMQKVKVGPVEQLRTLLFIVNTFHIGYQIQEILIMVKLYML